MDEKKTYLSIKNKSNVYKYRDLKIPNDKIEINKLIYKHGKDLMKELIEYKDKVELLSLTSIYDEIIEFGYYSKKDLNIKAEEIIEITRKQELTSYYIDMLSYEIIKGNLKNNYEELREYLERLI